MEKTTISLKKYILIYGAILGSIWIIYGFIRNITNNRTIITWALFIFELSLHIGFIVFGIYKFKKNNEGFLTLWQAFKIGLGIALLSTFMKIIGDIFFLKVISPETLQEIVSSTSQSTATGGQEKDSILKKENGHLFTTSLANLLFNSTLAILISLLGGAIMQKHRDPF